MCTTIHEVADRQNSVDFAATLRASEEQAMFNAQLATYRKIVAANLMFHREVYGLLRSLLRAQWPMPFTFLDIACGDASASAAVLQDCSIAQYHGIDLSPASLELAQHELRVLPCPVDLRCCDFVEAMSCWTDVIDVVWIGMSLHHLQLEGKAAMMRYVHRTLTRDGLFLLWEPTLLDQEDRRGWLDRFSTFRGDWAAISDEEFASMELHTELADFPETAETWKAIGYEAGFTRVEEVFMMPNRIGRVFQYRI
jgi:ubiquinone/menaquinone biosynthesis C-methylase UbiE